MAVSVGLLIYFYSSLSGVPEGADFETEMATYGNALDLFMYWAYILFAIAAVAAIGFPLVKLFTQPKEAVKTLISVAVIAVIVFIAYSLADDKVLDLTGYEGPDNVPETLKFAGTLLWTTYLLFGIAILSILYVEVSKIFK